MSDQLIGPEQYGQRIDECLAMAKASTSNKARADHYAQAEHYLRLFEKEAKLAGAQEAPLIAACNSPKARRGEGIQITLGYNRYRLAAQTNTKPFYSIF